MEDQNIQSRVVNEIRIFIITADNFNIFKSIGNVQKICWIAYGWLFI